jgi:hypothetical protein
MLWGPNEGYVLAFGNVLGAPSTAASPEGSPVTGEVELRVKTLVVLSDGGHEFMLFEIPLKHAGDTSNDQGSDWLKRL